MVRRNHAISGLFVFVLLGIFAVLSVLMVLRGAQVYRSVVLRAEAHNGDRLLPALVRQAVRAGDEAGTVRVADENGLPVLEVADTYDGERYLLRLYAWEGELYTSYMDEADGFAPEDGEALFAVSGFVPAVEDGMVRAVWTDAEGRTKETRGRLYAAGGEAQP